MRLIPFFVFVLSFLSLQAQFSQTGVIGSERLGIPQLHRPADATFAPDGLLYFINAGTHQIYVYEEDGTFVKSISTILNGVPFKPNSLAINADNEIYLLSFSSHSVAVIDSDGDLLFEFGSQGQNQSQFSSPLEIDIDEDGNVWIADYGNNRIKKFDESGVFISEFVSQMPVQLDVADNTVYVVEENPASNPAKLKKFSFTGVLEDEIVLPNPSVIGSITEIVAKEEDNLFVATFIGTVYSCDLAGNTLLPIPEPPNNDGMSPTGLALQVTKLFITDLMNRVYVHDIQANSTARLLEPNADGQFNRPLQMATDEDHNVYVADYYNHRIQVFDSDGNFIRKFGSFGLGNGDLNFPENIAIDLSNGDCYVLNSNKVSVFDFQGVFVRQFAMDGVGGIAVDQNYVYTYSRSNPGILRLDKNGVFQEKVIETGTGPGKIEGLRNFVIDADGNFYVAEVGSSKVQVFDNNGTLLQIIGQEGLGDGEFSFPMAIATDNQGRIYVNDIGSTGINRTQVFDEDGNLMAIIPLASGGNPQGIVVNGSGRVFVADLDNHYVQLFDGNLNSVEEPEIEVLLPAITYGDPNFQLTPTSPSTGAYQYEVVSGTDATIAQDGTVTILGAGQVSVRVTQSPTALYTQGVTVVVMDISKAILLVTANDETRTYGNQNPVFTANYTGFRNGDTFSAIDTPPQLTSGATSASPVGGYPIIPGNGSDDNYSFNYVSGTLTVEKAPLIITAENKSRKYGEVNPSFTFQYTGFLNNDTFSDLNSQPIGHTDADVNSHVGSYDIDLSGAADNNYEIEYVTGQLTIGKAALIVTISDASKIYGDENPEFTAVYDGFVNNDDLSDIDTPPVLGSTGVEVGEYPINALNGLDNDYEFVSVAGTLEITKASLTATAENQAREYNQPNPEFTIHYEGFKNNDDASDLIAEPLGSTSATQTSSVGTYPIILTGGTATNYELTLVNGQLTITKASQLISFGPLPSPVFNTLSPFALNATADSGLGVTYRVSSGPASVAANIVTLSGELGTVTIEATQPGNGNYNAADPVSQSFEVVEQPVTGIEDELSTLKVYPNPSKGEFWLSSPEGIQAYQVLNGNGVLITEQRDLRENDNVVNLQSVPNGIYILIVQTQQGKKFTRKISIVR